MDVSPSPLLQLSLYLLALLFHLSLPLSLSLQFSAASLFQVPLTGQSNASSAVTKSTVH